MDSRLADLTPSERLYLSRACELAQRGAGSTSPNPPVGAIVVRDGTTLGEGYHRVRGGPHAEIEALEDARRHDRDVRRATLFVSLEPCNHHGLTPPCSDAIVDAGIERVVIGVADPNPKTNRGGIARLREAGIVADVAEDATARALIEPFMTWVRRARPYVTLKMASSLDGYVAPKPGAHWLTGELARERVRELRYQHDAVMVGAGTIRVDDPQLTVRPPHARRRPYVRVVVCEDAPVPVQSRVFAAQDGYARTIVVAPAGAREKFAGLESIADCVFAGAGEKLDLPAALVALKDAGISSVLCEGGPTFAAGLLGASLVDRIVWVVAPAFLANPDAVPVLARGIDAQLCGFRFEDVERLADDLWLTAKLSRNV